MSIKQKQTCPECGAIMPLESISEEHRYFNNVQPKAFFYWWCSEGCGKGSAQVEVVTFVDELLRTVVMLEERLKANDSE